MCGILAWIGARPTAAPGGLARALDDMRRRGPDARGTHEDLGIWLGHRRLAIQDLDERSNQPMVSACGRYRIIYNGEIYNVAALRKEFDPRSLRTSSDTELILRLFERHGESMLPKLRGMFAFLIWDSETRRGFVARDPYGIKPLYWAQTSDGVVLGSQVRALLRTGMVSRSPCFEGQAGFWMFGSVPEPHTWFDAIKTLMPGHCAWIEGGRMADPKTWFRIEECWHQQADTGLTDREIAAEVRACLLESVKAHLVADVPVGVFLSGGIDSGAITGLMRDAGMRDLHAFTVAFDEFKGTANDEAPLASRVAAKYGVTHHVRSVSAREFESDLPRILSAMDQPSIDGINTWYASKAVAEAGLKVVMSGVGGDELFLGYESFRRLPRIVRSWRALSRVPGSAFVAQRWADAKARRSGNERWHQLPEWGLSIEGAWMLQRGLYSPREVQDLMRGRLTESWAQSVEPRSLIAQRCGTLPKPAELALGQIESVAYLRNQLLRDSDWASMDHSVELRTPLVDSWLLRSLGGLLPHFRRFRNKGLLAFAPLQPLPTEITSRRKTGFSIPVASWIGAAHGGSRAWAREVAKAYDGPYASQQA